MEPTPIFVMTINGTPAAAFSYRPVDLIDAINTEFGEDNVKIEIYPVYFVEGEVDSPVLDSKSILRLVKR